MIAASAKAMMVKALGHVPEIYRSNRQYNNAREFLNHREYALALECFLELADETEVYFPLNTGSFWLNLPIK